MELYLFRPEEHQRLYGCINITVEDVPLEERQHVVEGVIIIFLTFIYYILYIPCIYSIYRHMNNPCYKLLFFISIVDVSILWVLGFMHGYFAITGAVFCSHPTLIYILGCYLWGTWICETSGQLTLVINRCVAMISSELEKIYLEYVNNLHLYWDGSISVGLPALYILFSLLFFAKSHGMKGSQQVSRQQKLMLLQVFIISMLTFVTTSTYVSMMYFVPNEIQLHFAQFCFFHIHGFPPVIYLLFNPTIRTDARQMLKKLMNKFKEGETKDLATITSRFETLNKNVIQSNPAVVTPQGTGFRVSL